VVSPGVECVDEHLDDPLLVLGHEMRVHRQ
jgi:hypothetical protein